MDSITQSGHTSNLMGIVAWLWRYPVKSMCGEQCQFLDVNARGVEGDRLFAVRDTNGKFGSGKSTRRFRRIDGLLGFEAVYEGDIPTIRFPDGRAYQRPEKETLLRVTSEERRLHDSMLSAGVW